MEIRLQSINLYKANTKIREREREVLFEILSQVKGWMKEKNLERDLIKERSNSILVNKLVYYIANLLESKNPKLIISRGWYKYGPCFEDGRRNEESLSLIVFEKLEARKSNEIIPEIKSICEEHVPLFFQSIKTDKSKFPYDYLLYIYSKKQVYPWLKEYYTNKHKLEYLLRTNTIKGEESINKIFMDFDKSIMDHKYLNNIGVSENIVDKILEFTALLSTSYSKKDTENYELFQDMKDYFTDDLLMFFSHKNYEKTFLSSNQEFKRVIVERMKEYNRKFEKKLDEKLSLYYSLLT